MNETVLVTGASGYIASHCVKHLLEAGYKVRGTIAIRTDEQKLQSIYDIDKDGPLELVEADLRDASSCASAVAGCQHVIHVVTPCPDVDHPTDDDLVQTTVKNVTLNVLKACQEANSVMRVVVTSSAAEVVGPLPFPRGKIFTEDDWSNRRGRFSKLSRHAESKTLIEQAVWEYWGKLPVEGRVELAVLNPAFVVGPILGCTTMGTSSGMKVLAHIMERRMSRLPRVSLPTVDVRDVAAAHTAAITTHEAGGKRHLLSTKNLTLKEIGEMCSKEFKDQGYDPPTIDAPYWRFLVASWFDPIVRMLLSYTGNPLQIDNTRFTQVLAVQPRDLTDGIIDVVYRMIEKGMIKRASKYRPRPEPVKPKYRWNP